MSGHPIFDRFQPFEGYADPGFERSHYGVNVRDWLFAGESKGYNERRAASVGHPPVNSEYFEWIALLTAVGEAVGRFRMAEIGAGWGRWSVSGAALCRQRDIPYELIAAEAEPSHFEWLQLVFRDNEVDPAAHRLVQAAVSAADGPVYLAGPDKPKTVYGCRVVPGRERSDWERLPEYLCRPVEAISLQALVGDLLPIDLIDLDIQGTELEVIAAAIDVLDAGVKMMCVGTHSPEIERDLRDFLRSRLWRAAFDFAGGGLRETRFGPVEFEDGVQVWVNPHWPRLYRVLTS